MSNSLLTSMLQSPVLAFCRPLISLFFVDLNDRYWEKLTFSPGTLECSLGNVR
jgi:hypothetical protein